MTPISSMKKPGPRKEAALGFEPRPMKTASWIICALFYYGETVFRRKTPSLTKRSGVEALLAF